MTEQPDDAPAELAPYRVPDEIAQRADQVRDDFHHLWYGDFDNTWYSTTWFGVKVLKNPFDLWIYQELLHEQRPDVVLECGTAFGGSALWFAHMLELIGHGEVITIDVAGSDRYPGRPDHARIRYRQGSSIDPDLVRAVRAELEGCRAMVVLDSDHSARHVRSELVAWADLVPVGGYVIVEDTNIHGHPVYPEHPAGPMEGVRAFLADDHRFEPDRRRERLHLTLNPGGYLRRVA